MSVVCRNSCAACRIPAKVLPGPADGPARPGPTPVTHRDGEAGSGPAVSRRLGSGPAVGAETPERHGGFLDVELPRQLWLQTGSRAHHALDVADRTAAAAHEVVVVVVVLDLVPGRVTGDLGTPDQTGVREGTQHVVG